MTWTNMELFANVMTAICIFLAGRNNVHTWWTGIVACIGFMFVFYDAKLYADVALQIFFVVTGFIGWMQWQKNKRLGMSEQTEIQSVADYSLSLIGWVLVTAVAVAALYGLMLHHFTDAYAPWIDSTVLSFSILAQLLLMRRFKENWPVWLLVNTLSVPLFWSRELYLTSILYGFFWVNAVVSWKHWDKLFQEQIEVKS